MRERRTSGITSLMAGQTPACNFLPSSLASIIIGPLRITKGGLLRMGDMSCVPYFSNLLFFSFFFFIGI